MKKIICLLLVLSMVLLVGCGSSNSSSINSSELASLLNGQSSEDTTNNNSNFNASYGVSDTASFVCDGDVFSVGMTLYDIEKMGYSLYNYVDISDETDNPYDCYEISKTEIDGNKLHFDDYVYESIGEIQIPYGYFEIESKDTIGESVVKSYRIYLGGSYNPNNTVDSVRIINGNVEITTSDDVSSFKEKLQFAGLKDVSNQYTSADFANEENLKNVEKNSFICAKGEYEGDFFIMNNDNTAYMIALGDPDDDGKHPIAIGAGSVEDFD